MSRALFASEIAEAKRVFRNTLPYNQITVTNGLGAGGAQFTLAIPTFFGPWSYQLNMGPRGFANCLSISAVFIHELTHVWQGSHSNFPPAYMINSVFHQAIAVVQTGNRNNAYNYTPGSAWGSYNVEQQGNIVEDWYALGLRTTDPRFRYISGNIWPGHNF